MSEPSASEVLTAFTAHLAQLARMKWGLCDEDNNRVTDVLQAGIRERDRLQKALTPRVKSSPAEAFQRLRDLTPPEVAEAMLQGVLTPPVPAEESEAGLRLTWLREDAERQATRWENRARVIHGRLPDDSTPENVALAQCQISKAAALEECAAQLRVILKSETP